MARGNHVKAAMQDLAGMVDPTTQTSDPRAIEILPHDYSGPGHYVEDDGTEVIVFTIRPGRANTGAEPDDAA